MNIGAMSGLIASAAGTPLAQAKGSETDRARQEAAGQERRVQTDRQAEMAAGIGETDGEDHQTAERDADGRRLWEDMGAPHGSGEEESAEEQSPVPDPSGNRGNQLDLSG